MELGGGCGGAREETEGSREKEVKWRRKGRDID